MAHKIPNDTDVESRYKHLVEQNAAGVYEITGGKFTYVNSEFAAIFGYDRDELIDTSPFALIHEDEHDRLDQNMERLLSGETDAIQSKHRGKREDDSEVIVEVHGQILETDPEPVMIGFLVDVTDHENRRRRLEALFDNTYQFTGILDADGTLLDANETALTFVDATREAVTGRPVAETPWFDLESATATVQEAVRVASGGRQFRDEIRVRGQDEERIFDFTLRPVTDASGDVSLLIAEGHDITERKRQERDREQVISRVTDAIVKVDENWEFTLVDEQAQAIYEMSEADLLGEHFWDVFPEALDSRFEDVYRRVMQTRDPASLEEYFGATLQAWVHVDVYPTADGGVAFYFRDISERKRREKRQVGRNEMLEEFAGLSSESALCDAFLDSLDERFCLPFGSIYLLDDGTGDMELVGCSPHQWEHHAAPFLTGRGKGPIWETYLQGDAQVIETAAGGETVDSIPVETLVIVPLGNRGVAMVGCDQSDRQFVRTICNDLGTAVERVERERILAAREAELTEQNTRLTRAKRVNDVIRSIDRVLIDADCRGEIEVAVCSTLTAVDGYTFAWMGETEPSENRLVPSSSAGDGLGYLESHSLSTAGGMDSLPPAARAVSIRDSIVLDITNGRPPYEPWRTAAIKRGFKTAIALPLLYRETLYGVLTIYATEPGMFNDVEGTVLQELSETIAHAINSVESKRALVSDEIVEVALEIDLADREWLQFLHQDSERVLELDGIAPSADGPYHAFFLVRGATQAAIEEMVNRSVAIADWDPVREEENGHLVDFTLTEASLIYWLLDHGAVLRSIEATPDGGRLELELPRETSIRDFVERFQAAHSDGELVASRHRERPVYTRATLESAFESEVTPRQRETLQRAYLSGYFDTPRGRTGKEIAASMDISQPTFSDTVRAGLRNLLGVLYDGDEQ